jgi:uncharacterized RDD family membrane protein YckC
LLVAFPAAILALAPVEDNPDASALIWVMPVTIGALIWAALAGILVCYGMGRWGRTPGKWATGIRVVGTDLRPCGFWRALLRTLLLLVDGFLNLLLGVLLIAFTRHRQRLGDFLAQTLTIRETSIPLVFNPLQGPKTD